ncbi:hypothetical protein WJX72_007729 [[Myrmecia] bisecta]|uniref:Uncharacterized protein n=1 Tax=[Myrmecia] bisecta TaxID=41462 RepID=A0AAW1QRL3_9CHLO
MSDSSGHRFILLQCKGLVRLLQANAEQKATDAQTLARSLVDQSGSTRTDNAKQDSASKVTPWNIPG